MIVQIQNGLQDLCLDTSCLFKNQKETKNFHYLKYILLLINSMIIYELVT
jgi:hypothetical protein